MLVYFSAGSKRTWLLKTAFSVLKKFFPVGGLKKKLFSQKKKGILTESLKDLNHIKEHSLMVSEKGIIYRFNYLNHRKG